MSIMWVEYIQQVSEHSANGEKLTELLTSPHAHSLFNFSQTLTAEGQSGAVLLIGT